MPPTTTKRLTDQQISGLALRRLRKMADLTQAGAADKAGVTELTIRRYEKGERDLSLGKLIGVAEKLGFTEEDLLAERAKVSGATINEIASTSFAAPKVLSRVAVVGDGLLTVRDRVQAGAWLLADDLSQTDPTRLPAARDLRYPHADQWLSLVVGDSVNKLNIFDGDYVHCVDAISIGYHPRAGDLVEVMRTRGGGLERELTIKQVEIVGGEVQLWPRSTNPRWEPLVLSDVDENGREQEITIRGYVVGLNRRF